MWSLPGSLLSKSYLLILPFWSCKFKPPFFCFLKSERIEFLFLAPVFNRPLTLHLCVAVWSWSVRSWPARKPRCRDTMWWWVWIDSERRGPAVVLGLGEKKRRGALFWPCFDLSFPQYYEMSYGLNIEMHKQVGNCFCILTRRNWFEQTAAIKFHIFFWFKGVDMTVLWPLFTCSRASSLLFNRNLRVKLFRFRCKLFVQFLCWILEALNCFLSIINVCM